MGLALFARWLRANRHTFLCKHIAYLSLNHDGLNHVTKSAVEQREKMLRFVYSVADMPYPPPCVVPYDSAKFKHDEKFFVPYFGKSEEAPSDVVALVARPMPLCPAPISSTRFVTKAQAAVAWPLLPLGAAPSDFSSWWNSLGTDLAPEVHAAPCEGGLAAKTDEDEEDAQQTGLKAYQDTLQGHAAAVHLLFHELNTDPEAKTKERDFTPIVSKLVRFKDHLMDSPSWIPL